MDYSQGLKNPLEMDNSRLTLKQSNWGRDINSLILNVHSAVSDSSDLLFLSFNLLCFHTLRLNNFLAKINCRRSKIIMLTF